MKKLVYSLLLSALLITSCLNELEEEFDGIDTNPGRSIAISLSVTSQNKEALVLSDNTGLKSLAIDYTSTVSTGDTINWIVDENSYIKSVEDIIIISKDFDGDPFVGDIVFNEDKTQCYGILASDAVGTIKYDIKYTCADGSIVVVDPYIDVVQVDD